MTVKNGRTAPAGALLLHPFRFLLTIACFIAFAIPCRAASDDPLPGSGIQMDAVVSSEGNNFCQPADIDLKLKDKCLRAGLLYDVSADAVVWEKNRNQAFPIASLTKMMVALIAMEDVFDGKVDLETIVKVTPEAAKMNGSKVYLRTGCCLTVEELLKAAMISSGNDAAYLLAQFLGGTESAFVNRMNKRARQLGMNSTNYSNSTGMPARDSRNDNRSSPSDLLLLSLEMLKYKDLIEIAGMSNAVITQDHRTINLRNHNGLVAVYEDVDGFKTGFTQNAKYCLVATANKNGRRLISIVIGVSGRQTRNQFVATAISRYYEALGMGGLEPKTALASAQCVKKNTVASVSVSKSKSKEKPQSAAASKGQVHRVKKGDTLYKIASRYGCGVEELKTWNQIRGNRINPGQILAVNQTHSTGQTLSKGAIKDHSAQKSKAAVAKKAVVEKNTGARTVHLYTVRPGDTLWKIAQKFDGISVKDIMKENRIRRAKTLKPGTTLKIVMDA
ncbi:MAG: LysM peptidoglycan-binding domain-containing protein [Desulfobacteraceae bacterium]|nr:MAG: LysM peptidoglycan-binding domain-containing protein [Desulfobacteraceae bacterium]